LTLLLLNYYEGLIYLIKIFFAHSFLVYISGIILILEYAFCVIVILEMNSIIFYSVNILNLVENYYYQSIITIMWNGFCVFQEFKIVFHLEGCFKKLIIISLWWIIYQWKIITIKVLLQSCECIKIQKSYDFKTQNCTY
jgi:hypothetical protein